MTRKIIQQKNNDYPITKKTKNILIDLWTSLPHEQYENYFSFIEKELKTKIVKRNADLFEIGNGKNICLFDSCGSGTFEISLLINIKFEDEKEAVNWIERKINESQFLKLSDFESIGVSLVDADEFMQEYNQHYEEERKKDERRKEMQAMAKRAKAIVLAELKEKLMKEFDDEKEIDAVIDNILKHW